MSCRAGCCNTMADTLHEKAFQKQGAVSLVGRVGRKKGRWYRNVGLGIKTPREAIEGTYIDKKCPFTGNVSIRGRLFRGVVVSTKMTRTVIVRRDYLHWIRKYKRFEKRHRNIPAHVSPCFRIREGDQVTIGQVSNVVNLRKSLCIRMRRIHVLILIFSLVHLSCAYRRHVQRRRPSALLCSRLIDQHHPRTARRSSQECKPIFSAATRKSYSRCNTCVTQIVNMRTIKSFRRLAVSLRRLCHFNSYWDAK